jgi:hypothetical protein
MTLVSHARDRHVGPAAQVVAGVPPRSRKHTLPVGRTAQPAGGARRFLTA